jgi:hypothetical protein
LQAPKTNETQEITAGDFVFVRFATKKTKALYVGQVEEKEAFTYKVEFMRRQGGTWKFSFPDKDDMSEIEREDVAKLPRPVSSGGTASTTTLKYFGVNFSLFEE